MVGSIADLKREYRDFTTDGVRASGRHEPVKANMRSALDLLSSEISSIAAGLLRFETKALMDGDTTQDEGTLAYVWGDATAENNKVYQWEDGAWVAAAWYFDAVAGVLQPLVDDTIVARDTAIAATAPFQTLEQSMRATEDVLYSIDATDTTSWGISAGFGGVGFVADGAELLGDSDLPSVGALRAYLQAGADTTRIEYRLYQRLVADGDAVPGAAASDVVVKQGARDLTELGMTAGGAPRQVQFSFTPVAVSELYSYVFVFEAYGADDERKVIGFGQGAAPGGAPARYSGFYRSAPAGVWGMVGGAAVPSTWIYAGYADVPGMSRSIVSHDEQFAKIDLSFGSELRQVGQRATDGSSFPAADSHFRWAFGAQVGDDVPVDAVMSIVGASFELSTQIAKIALRIVERPTDPATYSSPPGTGPDDVVVHMSSKTPEELGVSAIGGVFQPIDYAFPPLTAAAGNTYLFEFTFYDQFGVTQGVGITNSLSAVGLDAEQRGFYDDGGVLGGSAALAWRLGYMIYVATSSAGSGGTDTRDMIATATAEIDGYDISVSGSFVRGGVSTAFADTVTLTAPTDGDVVDEARTLTNTPIGVPHRYYNADGVLAHANVSAVVVKDASTEAVLVLDTDYRLEPTSGVVSRVTDGANVDVEVSYHWSKRRYDLICIHAETRALSVVEGVERDTDAGEFLPVPDDSALMPLFYARVADGFSVEAIPRWYLDGMVHRDLIASRAADFERQRRALSTVIAMARRGETIRVAGMGDSILAQEQGYSPNDAPNGVTRDRTGYFLFNIGSDRVDNLPLYDQGDGAGAVHTRTSTGWAFCKALADLGATVEYYDFGIGGSGSGAGERNGGDPVLRAAVWGVSPHALISHFGMNETGSDDTEANLTDLFAEAANQGVLAVLAIGMPRPSSVKLHTMEAVRKTWRATRRAAENFRIDGQVRGAYFDPARLVDDGFAGAMGLSAKELGSADAYHHPGIHECAVYGAEIHALVCGE